MPISHAVAALASAALLTSCTIQEDPRAVAARSYVREVTGEDLKRPGRLEVHTTDVSTDGRFAKFRGYVRNKFDEPVEGVRYLVTIYSDASARTVLERWQREVDTTIESGERTNMSLDVESMYFGGYGGHITNIEAYPIKLGEESIAPPEGWR